MLIYLLIIGIVSSTNGFSLVRKYGRSTLVLTCSSDLSDLTIPQLKILLKDKGLPVSGRKSELIQRLSKPVTRKVEVGDGIGGKKMLLSMLKRAKKVAQEKVLLDREDQDLSKGLHENYGKPNVNGVEVENIHKHQSSDPLDDLIALGGEILKHSKITRDNSELNSVDGSIEYKNTDASRAGGGRKRTTGAPSAHVSSNDRDQRQLLQEIQDLVNERSQYRKIRDYSSADDIRDRLRFNYKVEIYDHKGMWEGPGGLVGPLNKFASPQDKAPATKQVACSLSKEEVRKYVEQRTIARRGRNFDEADNIRNMLAENGVELYDKLNEWATYDGRMSGLQSTDFYTGFGSEGSPEDANDGQDTIKVEDPVTGNVTFKTRKKQFADPDEDNYKME